MHFAGRSGEVKEYNIAVDALGRPLGFDPKRDSIVRVEAHRLRKRLGQYYEGEGAAHEVRIVIPSGQYVPRFVRVVSPVEVQAVVPADTPERGRRVRPRWVLAAGVACIAMAALLWTMRVRSQQTVFAIAEAPAGPEMRIRVASEMYADPLGRVWQADSFGKGGTQGRIAGSIKGARDPEIFAGYREGSFRYEIPAAAGRYELRLHFAEPIAPEDGLGPAGEGTRLVQVALNGTVVLRDLDIFAEAGARAAVTKAFRDVSPQADGKIRLEFSGTGRGALVSAIEVSPGIPGAAVPIRMVSRETPYTDVLGRLWEPDQFVTGGKLVFRVSRPAAEGDDPELYRGERYGALQYRIPVPPGTYTVVLRFAETWFGAGNPGGGGAGSRVVDILCNGVFLERDFDVFRAAGGSNRGLRRVYRGVRPNAQGVIALSLAPKQNYAEVNAVEVLDEGR
jgi:hypothetical protein